MLNAFFSQKLARRGLGPNRVVASLVAVLFCAVLVGRDVDFEVDPRGAVIEIVNLGDTRIREGAVYRAPATIDFRRRSDIYRLRISAPGYETKEVLYDYREDSDRRRIVVSLAKVEESKRFRVSSDPAGAEILLDGRRLGTTPADVSLEFSRRTANSPWSEAELILRKQDFEDKPVVVGLQSPAELETAALQPLRLVRPVRITAVNPGGEALEATVEIEGKVVGVTPYQADLAFTRPNSRAAWSEFKVRSFLENAFEPNEIQVSLQSGSEVELTLLPVTEMAVTRYFPTVIDSPSGPERIVDQTSPVGVLDVQDISYTPLDFRPVTNFQRNQDTLQAVNSFCLTPDGQSLIYSVTMQTDAGDFYSNLFIKSANDRSFVVSQITRGTRFLDCEPTMTREEGSNLVVFQSNRGPMESWDISSLMLRDGRVVGGIRQLTRERSRLNYGPSFVSEEQPVYFSSAETYPQAQPYISLVRPDGSSFTNLGEYGEQIVRTEGGLIYFVREAEDTGKKQIYSITSEGLQFSSVINDIEFGRANCMQPAVSPDGKYLLFVSDYHTDEKGRKNNNIYLYETATAIIQPLTDNGSDDVKPQWSPTEPGVFFFLSSRGGIYNIWRMQIPQN